MAERAPLVHENVVIVALPIEFLDDLLCQKGEFVPERAFVITFLLQLFFAFFVHQWATLVVHLELFDSLSDMLASSVFEGTVKGKLQPWNRLDFE